MSVTGSASHCGIVLCQAPIPLCLAQHGVSACVSKQRVTLKTLVTINIAYETPLYIAMQYAYT